MRELSEIKKDFQNHFTDGLMIIVGSGLSCAEGLSGMKDLSKHLQSTVPHLIEDKDQETWDLISNSLSAGNGLEDTLLKYPLTQELELIITDETIKFLLPQELKIIEQVISGEKVLRFTKLLPHLVKSNNGIPVITTNYDRLIEIATEASDIGVDTMFIGNTFGRLDIKESKLSFCRNIRIRKHKQIFLEYSNRINLFKPHGSFDWYLNNGHPIKCPMELQLPRLVITPGLNKFRTGYDRPFDSHREQANKYIDLAKRYLIIGYGFNDDHLQTHLSPEIRNGKPTLLISHSCSKEAEKLIAESDNMKAIVARDDKNKGFKYLTKNHNDNYDSTDWWDIEYFIKEVLEP